MKIGEFESLKGTKDIRVFTPLSLNEIEEVIEYLKYKPIILNLSKLKPDKKQRFLDLISGAIIVLDKNVCILDKDNYLFIKK